MNRLHDRSDATQILGFFKAVKFDELVKGRFQTAL